MFVVWQDWVRERTAIAVAIMSEEAQAYFSDHPEIAEWPSGILKVLCDEDGNELSISEDIADAFNEANARGLVIAAIYGLADAMRATNEEQKWP